MVIRGSKGYNDILFLARYAIYFLVEKRDIFSRTSEPEDLWFLISRYGGIIQQDLFLLLLM